MQHISLELLLMVIIMLWPMSYMTLGYVIAVKEGTLRQEKYKQCQRLGNVFSVTLIVIPWIFLGIATGFHPIIFLVIDLTGTIVFGGLGMFIYLITKRLNLV